MPATVTCSTATHAMWDAIDQMLLAACADRPATLETLADVSGLPAGVVKDQMHAHARAGRVTDVLPGSARYQLTITGLQHLARLNCATRAATRAA